MSTKFDSVAAFQKHGYTFAGFFAAVRTGFDKAYDDSQAKGFNPDGLISEASKARVDKVFQVLEEQYGSVDLKPLGPIAIVSAIGVFSAISDAIQGLESFANATPEDFTEVREQITAQAAARSVRVPNYAGAGEAN